MPGATTARLVEPCTPMFWKADMMPHTVPNSPMYGATLAVVATNATLTKAQALKVAQMAQDGLARSIVPSHTANDGDTVFALATGSLTSAQAPDVSRIGALAAEAVSDAIERAVRLAKGLPGYPSMSDLRGQ